MVDASSSLTERNAMPATTPDDLRPSLKFMVVDSLAKTDPTPLSTEELALPLARGGLVTHDDVEDALGQLLDGGLVHRLPAEDDKKLYLLTQPARLTLEVLNSE
jgi:hypothetical protein